MLKDGSKGKVEVIINVNGKELLFRLKRLQLADHKKRFEIIIQKLRDNGHRITPQRLAIVKFLAKSEGHPSVENIHVQIKKDFPTMSLATVYKNIVLIKSLIDSRYHIIFYILYS